MGQTALEKALIADFYGHFHKKTDLKTLNSVSPTELACCGLTRQPILAKSFIVLLEHFGGSRSREAVVSGENRLTVQTDGIRTVQPVIRMIKFLALRFGNGGGPGIVPPSF
jgi:hypothetical protein